VSIIKQTKLNNYHHVKVNMDEGDDDN